MELTTQTLGEICDEVTGIIRTGPFGSQLHESDYTAEGIPVVMPKNIVDGKISVEDIAHIGESDVARLLQHRMQEGDIVYGRRGDIGRRALITEREKGWICGTGCLRISLGNRILNPQFLYYFLGQPEVVAWIANQAVGATLPNLNTGIIRSIRVTYPAVSTQRKIAVILSAYDDLIENNTRRITILEEMAQSLYREWFVHFRFPGHEKNSMVESTLGMIPEGWEVVKLEDVATVYRGRSYAGKDIVTDGGLPFLNLKCIEREGGFRYDGLKRYQGPYKDTQTAKAGDIVMAVTDMTQERMIVARAARVPLAKWKLSVFSMDLVKITPKDESYREYLYGMLRFSNFPDEVKQHANGANVLHLAPERIEKFLFPLAPKSLAIKFSTICADLQQQCDMLQSQNANLRRTRDLLLPKLISGEVDVEGLDIDIGEVMSTKDAGAEPVTDEEVVLADEQKMTLWG